jgi:hypothetical protein
MKKLKKVVISLGIIMSISHLYGDNSSYNKAMAKNRANAHIGDSSYVKIRNKEEFKEAVKSGKIGGEVKGSSVQSTYRVIDMSGVNLNKKDLRDIKGDRVIIGSKVKGRAKLSQSVNIRNSRISTDRKLNVGVYSTSRNTSGIRTSNSIRNSSLRGAKRKKSRLDAFDEY